jgi:hypothetical protein
LMDFPLPQLVTGGFVFVFHIYPGILLVEESAHESRFDLPIQNDDFP